MTPEELDAIIKGVAAQIAPAATAAPATATAGWVGQAKAAKSNAKAKPVKVAPEPTTAYQPKPLSFEVQTVSYDATKHKAPFDSFRVLVVTNGANGKFNRSVRLDKRFLSAILEVGPKVLGQL